LTGHGFKATIVGQLELFTLFYQSFKRYFGFSSVVLVFHRQESINMKKFIFVFLLASISGASSANCTWGNCTPAERLQEYRQNQSNQLNSINNSLQQIQQQQQQQFQQQQIRPNDPSTWGVQPLYQQQPRCHVTSLGTIMCL